MHTLAYICIFHHLYNLCAFFSFSCVLEKLASGKKPTMWSVFVHMARKEGIRGFFKFSSYSVCILYCVGIYIYCIVYDRGVEPSLTRQLVVQSSKMLFYESIRDHIQQLISPSMAHYSSSFLPMTVTATSTNVSGNYNQDSYQYTQRKARNHEDTSFGGRWRQVVAMILAGGISGSIGVILGNPIDVVKVRMMSSGYHNVR